jgi:hypothetical protein
VIGQTKEAETIIFCEGGGRKREEGGRERASKEGRHHRKEIKNESILAGN